ncbi:hypothetical protein PAHAL_9G480000 [Panicum hallii]|uniref:Cytochrome P450 n=1 Tax=Panicum hallii TaxID=206008 RepID=A0A2S3IS00_9POAL|nr:hypothetical protein PAHAL_9G480000 [Panicum hallii]
MLPPRAMEPPGLRSPGPGAPPAGRPAGAPDVVAPPAGLRGTPYHLLAGDVRENARLIPEACSRPLPPRCHDIAPRVAPFLCRTVREHGGRACLSWFGPVPRVIVADPGVAGDVLSSKFGHLERPNFAALTRLLADGVAGLEGEKWVRHRRILNPAFHLEKLKSMLPAFSACCEEMGGVCWLRRLVRAGCLAGAPEPHRRRHFSHRVRQQLLPRGEADFPAPGRAS